MAHFRRLGRRFSIPSTAQILHEFCALSANEDARMRCAKEHGLPETATWKDIVGHRAGLEAESRPSNRQMLELPQSHGEGNTIGRREP